MNDIQISLLMLGLIIILCMILYNWVQLNRTREKQRKSEEYFRKKDPLFESATSQDQLGDFIPHDTNPSASVEFLKRNLPADIKTELESVVTFSSKKSYTADVLINDQIIQNLQNLKINIYLRKENEIWSTGEALHDGFVFDQIIISLALISRSYEITEEKKDSFLSYIRLIKEKLGVGEIWIANENIMEEASRLSVLKSIIDKQISIKVQPKTDSSFHIGAFVDFFSKSNIRLYKEFHWFFDPKIDGKKMFKVTSLNRAPLHIETDAFVQGIIFMMDIPNTPSPIEAFDYLIEVINEFCLKLNAVMVDASNKQIDAVHIEVIRKHIQKIEYEMNKLGIVPGENQSLKYFS
jgi:FtsZ-interacting cell division protein ZipA